MSYDIPSISELEAIQLLNKHYAEVITSKKDGVSSAADITQTTNPITGVTRRTLYKILDDAQMEHDAEISAHEVEHDNQIAAHEIEHDAQISAHEVEHDNQMQSFENDFDSRLAGMAFTRVGTFTAGATLTDMRQTLLWEVSQGGDGHEYGWTGSFLPSGKVVAAGATPATSGGIGAGAWVDRTDDSLRDEIRETVFQNMKRQAAEAGFNLVDGSFEEGAVISGWPDVVWSQADGKYYQWHLDEAKTVPAGSTPATSGGIGAGAWVDRTDVTLRIELLGNKSALVGPSGDYSDVQNALNLYNCVKLSGEIIQTTSSVLFDGFNRILNGGIDGSLCVGDRIYANSGLAKTGNSTVSVIKSDLSTVDVDCILHTNFEWRTMPDGKQYYPSSSKIEDLTLIGLSGNSAGYCVGLASGININRMTVTGCTDSFRFYDVFKSQISNINFDGQFYYKRGTTVTLTNATAYPNPNITTSAGFNIYKMVYSELHACTGDGLTVPTFRFNDCHNVTLTSCGCEDNHYEEDHGKFIYSTGYNELTIIDCTVDNNPTDTKANFRFTTYDKIRIIGGRSNLPHFVNRTNPDIYIAGNKCTVDVFGHTFKDQTDLSVDSIPSVVFAEGVTSSCVTVHLKNGRTVLITPSGVYDSNPTPFTPNINVDNSTFDFGVESATGTYSVNGKMVTVNGRIKLNANSTTPGAVAIGNLPISCSEDCYAPVTFYTEYALCPIYACLNNGRLIVPVKETLGPAFIRENLAYTDLSDRSEICFSVTYKGKHLNAF